jgi:hypothetical protein
MDKNGHVLFSDNFEGISVEIDLTQGIISTIYDFLNKDIENNKVHRLRYNNFTIVLHQGDNLILCYVFEGKSYSALQKFKHLLDDYEQFKGIWENLHLKLNAKEKLSLDDRNILTDYLESIFV